MLHWGRAHLTHSVVDLEAYREACKIENSDAYWYSERVRDSKNVVKSKGIKSSEGVFSSEDVEGGFDVVLSQFVTDSAQIYHSQMVDGAARILDCANVSMAINVCHSTAVARSKNIFRSQDVFDSTEIFDSEGATNSHFCGKCHDIKNCLFCYGLSNAEYHIFNKPVTKERFDLFVKQYKRLMECDYDVELRFVKDGWPKNLASGVVPICATSNVWFEAIPDKFWKWAKTIPGYDEMMLYEMTFFPRLLID
jgi:hypothetical protein